MACLSVKKDVFTFTWQIENFSMCAQKRGECLESPVFIVDGLPKSSWKLNLHPRSEKDTDGISLFLRRCGPAESRENKISLGYTLELYSSHPSKKPSKVDIKYKFAHGDGYGLPELLKRSAILNDISGDVLTARCCMWLQYKEDNADEILEDKKKCTLSSDNIKDLDVMKEMLSATNHDVAAFKYRFSPTECCARTQIKVERMSIVCPLAKFCKDESKKSIYLPIMSAMSCPSFILTVEKPDGDDDGWMSIKIQRIADLNSQHFVTGKITAFYSKIKSPVLFQKDDYLFEAGKQNDKWQFTNFIETNAMNELILSCEFAISTRKNENHTYEENKIVVECKTNRLKIETFSGLGNNFQDFYKCRNLPDVVLACEHHIYHVHRAVLLAKSKRFIDLLEEDEKYLDIQDLKPNVLNEMLMFMYHVEILDLKEKASDLYFAAHKYQIESLKLECSSVLKSELSISNVCKNLTLANGYKDFDLFSEIQNFIHNNAKEIFESAEWLYLSETNPKLALNMSQKILKQNM